MAAAALCAYLAAMLLAEPRPARFLPPKRPALPATRRFKVVSPFEPSGDQPQAIAQPVAGLKAGSATRCCLG